MDFTTIDLNKFDFSSLDNRNKKQEFYKKRNFSIVRFSLKFNCKKLENFKIK